MIFFFTGTDRDRARAAMNEAAQSAAGKAGEIVRISDAHRVADLESALRGAGMFGGRRVVVLEGILSNDEMRELFIAQMPMLAKADEDIFLYEEKADAATRRTIEKYAETSEKFEGVKGEKRGNEVFALAAALRRGDKKALWVGYQRALVRDEAPEAIHGILFWGAKQALLASNTQRSRQLVAELAELPHEARRRGFELEYALEKYILGINKS